MLGSRQPPIVGSPEQVADQLIAWVNNADVDGFNLSRTVVPECLESFINLVLPILQERGAYKRDYAPAPTGRSCSVAATGCLASIWRRWHAGSNKEGVGGMCPVRRDQSSLRCRLRAIGNRRTRLLTVEHGECPFQLFPIPFPPPIGRRLWFGTSQRV